MRRRWNGKPARRCGQRIGSWSRRSDRSDAADAARADARWRYWAGRAAEQAHDRALGDGNCTNRSSRTTTTIRRWRRRGSIGRSSRTARNCAGRHERDARDRTVPGLRAFARTAAARACGAKRMAEWQYGYESLAEAARPQTIHLAADWGWFDQAVATATQQRVFNDYALLYPRPFDKEVRAAAKLTDLDPRTDLRRVAAGKSVSRRCRVVGGRLRLAAIAAVNRAPHRAALEAAAALDRRSVRSVDQRDAGRRPTANIARPVRWSDRSRAGRLQRRAQLRPRAGCPSQSVDPDIWIENIPYNETRGYVQRVLWHSLVFAWLRSGDAQRTDAWLARIGSPDRSGRARRCCERPWLMNRSGFRQPVRPTLR